MSGRRKLVTGRRSTSSLLSAIDVVVGVVLDRFGGVGIAVGGVGFVLVGFVFIVGGVVGFVLGGIGFVGFVVSVVQRHFLQSRQAPANLCAGLAMVPRSLGWVRGLLPDEEGMTWWAEVISCLAETSNRGERRRYLRSYRRSVPQLVWTSWAEHLSASRRRELS
jgi:hypothetical protein